jgi:hypothetical protein
MAEREAQQGQCDTVEAVKAAIEAGVRERLEGLAEPGRVIPRALPDEHLIRLMIELAAEATADDELAISALQEAMRERGMAVRSAKMLKLDFYAVRGISDAG